VRIVSATAIGEHDRVDARPRRRRLPAGLLRLASDERLVELLRGGSEAAFEVLYTRHHRGVLSFCRHMLGSAEEAEDAVQHTFLAAYGDILGPAKHIQLRPWLYAIARNRCLTVLRARREQAGGELPEPSTEHLSIEVERRHELRALLGDLAGLPDDQRAALVLAELGDMSHDEIGQALGCPREKVKALVFQARSSLIASREAREASCAEIREQLANLRGGALRRNLLRRHLRECTGCREFREQVRVQRRDLALILPVAPSLGLQAAVLGAGGAAATSSVVAKTAIVLAVAGGGAAAAETVREEPRERPAARSQRAPAPAAAPSLAPVVVPSAGVERPTAPLLSTGQRPAERSRSSEPRPAADRRRAATRRRRAEGRGPAGRPEDRGPAVERGRPEDRGRANSGRPAESQRARPSETVRVKEPKAVKIEQATPAKAEPAEPAKVVEVRAPERLMPSQAAEAVPEAVELPAKARKQTG
jgi:RNA polymerase sigma factor (sigma-70 family)